MWLWKKFWNTDIIGKIYILIILFIVVVATITVITRYNKVNKKEIKQEKNTTNIEQLSHNDNIAIIETASIDNISKENVVETENEKNVKDTVVEAKGNTKKQTTSSVKTESINVTQPKLETETNNSIQEIITENKVIDAQSMDAEIEEQLPTSVLTNNVEEYRINQTMIETIKSVINNNPSEDMKTYGFELVVDSSIPQLTNEFTYSESRVKSKIAYKFGTIKIYARDYYCNGNYISTQCFII